MSTYVISDIHGCYNELFLMLDKINFSDTDRLILAGDYIDRGNDSYKMLKWMESIPKNIHLVRGNHDEEFAAYIDLMCQIDRIENLRTDFTSNKDTILLYETTNYFIKQKGFSFSYFDLYGTIENLLNNYDIALDALSGWADIIRRMPYYYECKIKGKTYIIVHAGYVDSLENVGPNFLSLEEFYLYARTESCKLGGKCHATIIAGHTPTIVKGQFAYNAGKIFRYYDEKKDCTFYDIDCGCVFHSQDSDANLACLRLEDEEIIYLY